MGILDRIIARGENKATNEPNAPENVNKETKQESVAQNNANTNEQPQSQSISSPTDPQETPAQEIIAPQPQPQTKAGFFGTIASAVNYTNQPLPPLKTYTGARKLGRASFILSLIAAISICTVCGLFAIMWLLSMTGASTGLGELFSEEANFISGGLAGMVGILGFIMMGIGVLLVLALLVGFCYFPVFSTLLVKRKMVYPAGLYSLNTLSNIIIIAGNFVYCVLLLLLAGLVISNHGSPIVYGPLFAVSAMMLTISILTIVDWVKSKKTYQNLNEETKAEYDSEYQNIRAHERRKRRARDAKRSLWS